MIDAPFTDDRVALRPWRPADAPALAAAWADPDIVKWTGVPDDRSAAAAARWIGGWDERRRRGLALDLAIVLIGDESRVVGEVGASFVNRPPAVGWWVLPEARGRGVATRAVRLFVTELLGRGGVAELVAEVDAANPASLAVARRAGFAPEGPPGHVVLRRPPPASPAN